jgi:hypothetical protein
MKLLTILSLFMITQCGVHKAIPKNYSYEIAISGTNIPYTVRHYVSCNGFVYEFVLMHNFKTKTKISTNETESSLSFDTMHCNVFKLGVQDFYQIDSFKTNFKIQKKRAVKELFRNDIDKEVVHYNKMTKDTLINGQKYYYRDSIVKNDSAHYCVKDMIIAVPAIASIYNFIKIINDTPNSSFAGLIAVDYKANTILNNYIENVKVLDIKTEKTCSTIAEKLFPK